MHEKLSIFVLLDKMGIVECIVFYWILCDGAFAHLLQQKNERKQIEKNNRRRRRESIRSTFLDFFEWLMNFQ